jgi:non-ribosomal peptide synthetase component E (peptide arylation enzyme)
MTVLMRWFDPFGWLGLAERHKVNVSPLVPAMLQMLLQQPLEVRIVDAIPLTSVLKTDRRLLHARLLAESGS